MRFLLLKNILSFKFNYNSIKRYIFVLNVCFFLSIFALIASLISIYFQNLINKYDEVKLQLVTYRQIIKSTTDYFNKYEGFLNNIVLEIKRDEHFADTILYLNDSKKKIVTAREKYLLNVNHLLHSKDGLLEDLNADLEKDFKDLIKWNALNKTDLKNYVAINSGIKKILEKIYNDSELDFNINKRDIIHFEEGKRVVKNEIYFAQPKEKLVIINENGKKIIKRISNINYEKYSQLNKDTFNFLAGYQFNVSLLDKMFLDILNYFDLAIQNLDKINSDLSKKTNYIILIAFFLQLIIFMFTNFFEISTYVEEHEQNKNKI